MRIVSVTLGLCALLMLPAMTVVQSGGTRDSPLRMGQAGTIAAYDVAVVAYDSNATSRLLGAAENNRPPLVGRVYVVVRVDVTYTGKDVGNPSGIRWSFIGSGNTEIPDTRCELYGKSLDDEGRSLDLFEGGQTSFEVCAQVPENEIPRLELYARNGSSDRVFFALDPNFPPSTPTTTPPATPGP